MFEIGLIFRQNSTRQDSAGDGLFGFAGPDSTNKVRFIYSFGHPTKLAGCGRRFTQNKHQSNQHLYSVIPRNPSANFSDHLVTRFAESVVFLSHTSHWGLLQKKVRFETCVCFRRLVRFREKLHHEKSCKRANLHETYQPVGTFHFCNRPQYYQNLSLLVCLL